MQRKENIIKTIIGEVRNFHEGYNPDTESGIICQCGKAVIIKNEDRDPITTIQCPICGFQVQLICGQLFNKALI